MNLKLLTLCPSSKGNTTLEWTTKAEQVSHITYSMQVTERNSYLLEQY